MSVSLSIWIRSGIRRATGLNVMALYDRQADAPPENR